MRIGGKNTEYVMRAFATLKLMVRFNLSNNTIRKNMWKLYAKEGT